MQLKLTVDAPMGTVRSSPLLLRLVHLDVGDLQRVHIKTLDLQLQCVQLLESGFHPIIEMSKGNMGRGACRFELLSLQSSRWGQILCQVG
jgi:hypothetical protein